MSTQPCPNGCGDLVISEKLEITPTATDDEEQEEQEDHE